MTITLEQVRAAAKELVAEEGPETFRECYYSVEGRSRNKALEVDRKEYRLPPIANGYQYISTEFYAKINAPVPDATESVCIAGGLVKKLTGLEGLRQLCEGLNVSDQYEIFSELGFAPEAIQYTQSLQEVQDSGETWGQAYGEAEQRVESGEIA